MTLDERIEPMPLLGRIHRARQLHRAQHVRLKFEPDPLEFPAQKAVIEMCVVRDEKTPVHPLEEVRREFIEGGGVAHHRVGDAGQVLDERRNRLLWIDERTPLRQSGRPGLDDADFGNPIDAE